MDAFWKALPPLVASVAVLLQLLILYPPLNVPKRLKAPLAVLAIAFIWVGYLLMGWLARELLYSPTILNLVIVVGAAFLLALFLLEKPEHQGPTSVGLTMFVVALALLSAGLSAYLPRDSDRFILLVSDPNVTQVWWESQQDRNIDLVKTMLGERGAILMRREAPDGLVIEMTCNTSGLLANQVLTTPKMRGALDAYVIADKCQPP